MRSDLVHHMAGDQRNAMVIKVFCQSPNDVPGLQLIEDGTDDHGNHRIGRPGPEHGGQRFECRVFRVVQVSQIPAQHRLDQSVGERDHHEGILGNESQHCRKCCDQGRGPVQAKIRATRRPGNQ
ncbi:Uncharacterised protein [Mycobacteroides abscessus subsp. massiliense]|nr:Uncharacterised protein [Mycobacteroides abscessus subsp. massiliense]